MPTRGRQRPRNVQPIAEKPPKPDERIGLKKINRFLDELFPNGNSTE